MAVYFTSDTHFGHGWALRFRDRPFPSLQAMDEAMVERWNETVGAGDTVWHLGDFALGRGAGFAASVLARLNGRKHLILGNNDGPETASLPGWESVGHYAEIEVEGTWLVMCHYPFRTWNGMYKGALNFHGHSHGKLALMPKQVDVGVDVWDFRPVTLDRIKAGMKARSRRRDKAAPAAGRAQPPAG
jgi:calcineurin-like phosphoesterase family protein